MSTIELLNICKSFAGKDVLKNINLRIEQGQFFSLLGPSGCGKTTTLKIIAGLIKPDSGDILFDGCSVLNIKTEKRGATIVFQDYLLFPHMTVEENIGFGLKMTGVGKKIRHEKVKELMELVQLNGYEKKYPSEISGGQRQRAALARALAINPRVLLLDEPFSSLDERLRDNMREFVLDLQRRLKITTILVTHDKEEALMLSDKIALMFDGKIIQIGTPNELYNMPVSREAADFWGDNNYIEGKVEKGVFKCCFGDFNVGFEKDSDVVAMIRPEFVYLNLNYLDGQIKGKILKKKYAGDKVYYEVLASNNILKSTTISTNLLEVGDEVGIFVDFKRAIYYLQKQ
ncbi:Spermidine/putrescine import ATP-binding protein PotA [Caloramator mitchellensis]|uniref:ABC-type quaternary amine transporter n=1 Tax=Caloramator mitchellensis TaxID=908809 RepID=A0A0R3JV66_CALMK|nr:ABC transporter ATP-binding protein [Caloramator mitchellensis]KRQ87456.1 Spermidine/putrescine import ATP-binding protein PotA [Caloramator mitchellensis]